MDDRPEGSLEVISVGDPDAPRRRPPRWLAALAVVALGGLAVTAGARTLADDASARQAGESTQARPAPTTSPTYVTSGLPPPYDIHGPAQDETPPPQRPIVGLPDGSYLLPDQEAAGPRRLGGDLVGGLANGAALVVHDGNAVSVVRRDPGGGPATLLARTPWYLGTVADRIYVALPANGRLVVRAVRTDGRVIADQPLPPGSLAPGGWLPRFLVGSSPVGGSAVGGAPGVLVERFTNRAGPGRDIGVLRPGARVELVARDALLAGVVDDLVLTRRGGFGETSLGVTRVTSGRLERYELALPSGWRLAAEATLVNAAGVAAFPVQATADPALTAVAYAAAGDRMARLVPGSYQASPQSGLASDARHLVFVVQTGRGLRPAVWHPTFERSARYLAGEVPEGGRLACRSGPQPCGYAVWPKPRSFANR